MLPYSSCQTHKLLKELTLPLLTVFKKLTSGKVDLLKVAKLFLEK